MIDIPRDPAERNRIDAGVAFTQRFAERVQSAAGELRSLLADVKKPAAGTGPPSQLAVEARELVNAVFWRAAGLLALLFGLAVVYRLVVRREGVHRQPDPA